MIEPTLTDIHVITKSALQIIEHEAWRLHGIATQGPTVDLDRDDLADMHEAIANLMDAYELLDRTHRHG